MTIQEVLALGQTLLKNSGIPNPALDAQVLLSHLLGISRESIYLDRERLLSLKEVSAYKGLLDLRCLRVPIAYIVGKKEFYGVDFKVAPGVLIPRPETEFVVESALEFLKDKEDPIMVDLCCGSGIIGISVALHNPRVQVIALDISKVAGRITLENAATHGVEDRVTFLLGDLWEPLEQRGIFDVDLVASNPPYIPTGEIFGLSRDVQHEPVLALDGGADGVRFYRAIAEGAPRHLKLQGGLIMEIGYDQAAQVETLLKEAGFREISVIKDYAGLDRVIRAVA